MSKRPNVGSVYYFPVYGRQVPCRVVKVHPFGTVDVVRLADEKVFRITGLGWI